MNARDFYSAFVRTARESTLVTKEMLPSFPEAWGMATFLDLYRNNEPAYTSWSTSISFTRSSEMPE